VRPVADRDVLEPATILNRQIRILYFKFVGFRFVTQFSSTKLKTIDFCLNFKVVYLELHYFFLL